MTNKIISVLKITLVGSASIVAFLSILFILGVFNSAELKVGIAQIVKIAGILAVTCFVVVFVLNYGKEKS